MTARRAGWIAWSMWVAGVFAIGLAALLSSMNPPISTVQSPESALEGALWLSTWVGFGFVGALIVSRRPENRIGWVLCGITLSLGVGQFASAYARFTLVTEPGTWPLREAAAWIATWAFFPVLALVVILVVLYPTGRPSRLGTWVLFAFLSVAFVDMVVYAIRPGPVEGDTPPNNPLGVPGTGELLDSMTGWLGNLLGFIALVALVDVFLRFRRSAGVERLQFRWFFIAIAMFPVMWFGGIFLEEFVVGVEGFDPVVIGFALWGNGTAAAIGVAITRHGLYEIDRIISRTLSYTLVVVLLGAVYLTGVTWLTSLLPDQSQLVVAATTLAVATLFNPLRKWAQGWVDRRFNRSRYDTQRVMYGFAASLRDQVDAERVVEGWMGVVTETMQPASVAVWTKSAFRNDSETVES